MQWNDFIYCMVSMSIAGNIGWILFMLMQKALRLIRLELAALKTVIMLFLVPVVYPLLCLSRLRIAGGKWVMINILGSYTPMEVDSVFRLASFIWAIVLVVGISIRTYQYMRFQNLIKQSTPLEDSEWKELVESYSKRYLIEPVKIYYNEKLRSPMVVGVNKPMIVLPDKVFDRKQKCMIIEHELYHIQNKDILWKKIAMWVTLIHWYNPFAYWLFERLLLEEEINCDLSVCNINPNYTVKEYGMFLYEGAVISEQYVFSSGLFEVGSELKRRITAISKRQRMRRLSNRMVALCCCLLFLCSEILAYVLCECGIVY